MRPTWSGHVRRAAADRRVVRVAGPAVGVGVAALGSAIGADAAVAAGVSLGAVLVLLGARRPAQVTLVGCGLVAAGASLATTAAGWNDVPLEDPNAGWGLLETAALLALTALTVRSSVTIGAWLTVTALVLAQVLWITRFVPTRTTSALVGACAAWAIGSAAAIVAGAYPRLAARRLDRRLVAAQAAHRRQLERDLHDYVAHDLSGIIVQAQAARYVSPDDPAQLLAALARIEETGQKAMRSMDNALELLRDGEDLDRLGYLSGQPTLAQAHALVESFVRSTSADVECRIDEHLDALPRTVSVTLFRALVELLTNVRRHAADATHIEVVVAAVGNEAVVVVRNDGLAEEAVERSPGRGGTGLSFLRARVEALGGRLRAQQSGREWWAEAALPVGGAGRR